MAWRGTLALDYRRDDLATGARTIVRDRHDGPLRVLASLYPEAATVCHSVLVHPPGGLVGGDTLDIGIAVDREAHALITTPGATRYYRSTGTPAVQRVRATLAEGARLEWLPLETIAYSGCIAESLMRFELAPQAEMMGWDVLALGLPASDQAFVSGRYTQAIELPGSWLERGVIDAHDTRLLDAPIGWAGQRVMGTLWFAAGRALPTTRRDALLDAARALVDADDALRARAGATATHDSVIVLRVLAHRVEPLMSLLTRVWGAWRECAWQLAPTAPRVWRT